MADGTTKRLLFSSPNEPPRSGVAEKIQSPPIEPSASPLESIQVVVRLRPHEGAKCVALEENTVFVTNTLRHQQYHFQTVFPEDASQEQVFSKSCCQLVDSAVDGFNATIMAYGQTSSGKTHTMFGDLNPGQKGGLSTEGGVIPAAVSRIFNRIESKEGVQYLLMVSFMELYNERVRDLLDPDSKLSSGTKSLDVRQDKNKKFHVPNLTMHVVTNAAEILNFVVSGQRRRETAATHQNAVSSRSHSILTIYIESCISSETGPDTKRFRFAKLNLVDLAVILP